MTTVLYGRGETYLDVTDIARRRCTDGRRIYFPGHDVLRAQMFGDPLPGVVKEIVVIDGEPRRFEAGTAVAIPIPEEWRSDPPPRRGRPVPPQLQYVSDRIAYIRRQLVLTGGSLNDEMAEQMMAVRHIRADAKVLELGANIGRNTLTIASLLADDSNLVTLECDPAAVEMLRNNRYLNGMGFHIEPSALSYRKLMQRGWETLPGDELREGYRWVSTITVEELRAKYPIAFDTLVADCEGSLYFILSDNDTLLTGITTVILESDYLDADHKRAVEEIFTRYGLEKVYSEALEIDWAHNFPPECTDSFFEVWKRAV